MIKRSMILIALTLCLSNLSKGGNKNSLSVKAHKESTFILQLPQGKQIDYHVVLRDSNGYVLHQENVEAGIELRKYNLKNLPSGEYMLCVSNDQSTKCQAIVKEMDTLLIAQEEIQTIIRPVLSRHDEYIDLNMLCFSTSKILVEILDAEGHLLTEELLDANGSIQRRYNFNSLKKGNYQIRVSMEAANIDVEYVENIQWLPQYRATMPSTYVFSH